MVNHSPAGSLVHDFATFECEVSSLVQIDRTLRPDLPQYDKARRQFRLAPHFGVGFCKFGKKLVGLGRPIWQIQAIRTSHPSPRCHLSNLNASYWDRDCASLPYARDELVSVEYNVAIQCEWFAGWLFYGLQNAL